MDVAQYRSGRIHRVVTGAQRRSCAGRPESRLLRPRSLQPARIDESRYALSRKGGPRSRKARPRALFLLRSFRCGYPGLWLDDAPEFFAVMRGGGPQPAGRAATPSGAVRARGRPSGERGFLLCRAECPIGEERRGLLPLDVSGGNIVLESA